MANAVMVKAWFKKSIRDYHSSNALLSLDDNQLENSIYHAQQSIEKSIKGFLVFNNIRFAKIHNLDVLVNLAKNADQTPSFLAGNIEFLSTISDYAYAARYPDASKQPGPPTREFAKSATEFALKCFNDLSKLSQIHPEDLGS